ncbi:hypothetical protein Bca52824_059362 [Brassica carinata]|uniref:Uncharacterized protein n=1 Tax=Brassica carinata TaxID=52824 RepID=A0A8X7QVQ5_BRACI|nr:hypothetical protein Bca52824_059362 [Brassica carinata]
MTQTINSMKNILTMTWAGMSIKMNDTMQGFIESYDGKPARVDTLSKTKPMNSYNEHRKDTKLKQRTLARTPNK